MQPRRVDGNGAAQRAGPALEGQQGVGAQHGGEADDEKGCHVRCLPGLPPGLPAGL